MKDVIRHIGLSALTVAILAGCSSTATTTAPKSAPATPLVALSAPPQVDKALTLNQIMANPDWMGLQAKGAYWSDDSQSIYFARQAHSNPVKTYYQQNVSSQTANELVLNQLHAADQQYGVLDNDKARKAYIYQGNLFVKELSSAKITQLTRQNTKVDGVRFLNNGDIAYWQVITFSR